LSGQQKARAVVVDVISSDKGLPPQDLNQPARSEISSGALTPGGGLPSTFALLGLQVSPFIGTSLPRVSHLIKGFDF